jgi:hypothetical protein
VPLVYLAERLRRIALGLTAALITARAFWPSEPNMREGAGEGLSWILVLLFVVGLALAVPLLGGRLRFRWSATDGLIIAVVILVAASASHALDRRPAINLAWEWAALGFSYLLLRNLPRTRNESSVLAGAFVATAVAVSAYGLYQVKIELPLMQAEFERNPRAFLQKLSIEPGTRGELLLRNRLMSSSEPWSTFALANSLAGYIAGPLLMVLGVALYNLVRPKEPGSRWAALAMAGPLILVLLVCLTLTKSRSAYLGVFIGLCVLHWKSRRHVAPRELLITGLAGILVVAGLVIAGLATKRLDPQVLTQSPMSMRYRLEYWRGTWGVITEGANTFAGALAAPTFWWGVGPGNFAGPYVRHKLPEASEEILDPHNLFLEVWATAGFLAVTALVGALACGFWNLFGPPSPALASAELDRSSRRKLRRRQRMIDRDASEPPGEDEQDDLPPNRIGWLIAASGAGWAVVILLGRLNLFEADLLSRWLILGASWLAAVLLGAPLWRRVHLPALAVGCGALAVVINLLAMGGIGIPTVALLLWSMLALGLNLRDDRRCSHIFEYDNRMPAVGMAAGWSALLGTFFGVVVPFWKSESDMTQAEAAIRHIPPNHQGAETAYLDAIRNDGYSARPWVNLASLYWIRWKERGGKVEDPVWRQIPIVYDWATTPPRNPQAWTLHAEKARMIQNLLNEVGAKLDPIESVKYRGKIVEATRRAARLYPTSAELHAKLAEASAGIHMFQDAATEAAEALRLDRITPHPDKKLPESERRRLEKLIPEWSESAAKMPIKAAP